MIYPGTKPEDYPDMAAVEQRVRDQAKAAGDRFREKYPHIAGR